MVMTPEEIKIQTDSLREQIRQHEEEIEVLRLQIQQVQVRCKHPNRFDTCFMGDSGTKCPDCGRVT